MPLRGVIFDMGGTLLSYHPSESEPQHGWQAMERLGADGLHAFLQSRGYTVPSLEQARAANFAVMARHWQQIGTDDTANPRLQDMLREVMLDWGLPPADVADGLLDAALRAYVTPVQAIVRPLPGAQELLTGLKARGLRRGLFSNTAWPGAFHMADLERWGLAPYLECAFFSADVAAWKPAPVVFQMALDALGLRPEEALYVGDHPYFDVYGAQQAGLRGVWVRSAEWALRQPDLEITPDAILDRLPDLLDVIESWL
ncbi:MAG: HAD family hydrolase [Anaerolineae bacterium]|nr:HAD family hydrolase [Anaerolineae bacterium]